MVAIISPSSTGLGGTEDAKVGCVVVEMAQLQLSFRGGLGLQHSLKFGLEMGNSEAKVQQMMFDDMILTPFSISPMTDTAVDSLPALFLAYCMLADSDDILSIDDRVMPWGLVSDPVPLLTDCAFSLGPSFLSRSRR
jgi:hypothetical protein